MDTANSSANVPEKLNISQIKQKLIKAQGQPNGSSWHRKLNTRPEKFVTA
ncbi:hypothetical protein [Stenotrophomonas sp.]|nr:hypothetical protein [Stenotrophomonas sp.]